MKCAQKYRKSELEFLGTLLQYFDCIYGIFENLTVFNHFLNGFQYLHNEKWPIFGKKLGTPILLARGGKKFTHFYNNGLQ